MNQIQPTTHIFILPFLINFRPVVVFIGSWYQFGYFTIFLTYWTGKMSKICRKSKMVHQGPYTSWHEMTQNINNEGSVWTGYLFMCVCVCVFWGVVANLWLTWLNIPFHFAHKSARVENISWEIRPIGNILIKSYFSCMSIMPTSAFV